jgi:BON domain-containing protein
MATRWEERDRGEYKDDRPGGRRVDEWRDERHDRDWTDRFAGSMERGWDRARDAVRNATDRDRDGRRGFAEWNDNDRSWEGSRGPWRRDREPDYWNRERSFGDTRRYANVDPNDTAGWNRPTYSGRDWQDRGGYSGRGPRGYQRGDERIREDICERLTEDPRIDASDVNVHVESAEVTLSGSVRTRDEKHFTENVVERIFGVREVNNNLKVRPPDEVLGTARSGSSMLGLTETPPPEPRSQSK